MRGVIPFCKSLLLFLTLVAAFPVLAQDCDRACLEGLMNQFLEAQLKHDATGLPLTSDMRYTENGQDIELNDGLWKTCSKHSSYKLYVADPVAGQLAFLSVIEESDTPVITHYRMNVVNQQIAEMEVLLARGSMGTLENLVEPKAIFLETLPPDQRRSREEMVAITNAYFTGLDEEDSGANVPFHPTRT